MQRIRIALSVLVVFSLATIARSADEKPAYGTDDFVTSYWFGPPGDFNTLERYQEIKDANFTLAFPIWIGLSVERNRAILDHCQKLGMKAIIADSRMVSSIGGNEQNKKALDAIVKDYGDHPALLAYYVSDEPPAGGFDGLGEVVAYLKQRDPKHPGYINILPTWARQIPHPDGNKKLSYLGTATYEEYVRQFVQKVKPAWLCYDNYGMLKHGDRGDFHENLETIRKVAQEANIPFWNIVLVTQHGDFRVLTEPELRFEAMQTMAFGGRGVVWFTYWSPQGFDTGTTWTHAMIDEKGNRTAHYDMVRTINADVLAIGRELKNAKNVGLVQREKGKSAETGDVKLTLDGGNVSVGVFATPEGKHLALVANRDYKAATKVNLGVNNSIAKLERFDVTQRTWRSASDARSVEVQLAPGAAELVRW